MEGDFVQHLTSAAMVVYLIQWFKACPRYQRFVQWTPIANAWVHRIVSILGAIAGAEGIHFAVTGDFSTGWNVALAVPPVLTMLHATWEIVNQFVLQQLGHDFLTNKSSAVVNVAEVIPVAEKGTI